MYISVTKITIVLCWLSLFAFWAIKIFGGNWFEIMVENENFIKFSDAVQNTWLKYIVSIITICISNYLMLGAILQKFALSGKYFIVYFISISVSWTSANFINIDLVKMLGGYTVAILASLILQYKWKKLFGFLSVGLDFIFVTISMITRNIYVEVLSNYMIALVLSIDIYIMYSLYFLYFNLMRLKKEN